MSLLSENVIPGNHGKIFGTNAKTHQELVKIKESKEPLLFPKRNNQLCFWTI